MTDIIPDAVDTRQPHRLRSAIEETVKLLMIEASPGFTNVRLR